MRFLCGVFAMGCFGLLGSAVGVMGMGEGGRGMRGAGGFWGSLWKRGGFGLRWLSGW